MPPNERDSDHENRNAQNPDRRDQGGPDPSVGEEYTREADELVDRLSELDEILAALDADGPSDETATEDARSGMSQSGSERETGADFVYPGTDSSKTDDRSERLNDDAPGEVTELQELVEELRVAVSDSLRRHPGKSVSKGSQTPRNPSEGDRSPGTSGPETSASRETKTVSLREVVRALTEVIETVAAISEELQDTRQVNAVLWEILNDIQVEVVEVQREVSQLDATQSTGEKPSPASEDVVEEPEQLQRLRDQLTDLLQPYAVDVEDDSVDGSAEEPAGTDPTELSALREKIDGLHAESGDRKEEGEGGPADQAIEELREMIDEVREQASAGPTDDDLEELHERIEDLREEAQAGHTSPQIEELRQEIDDVREAVAVVRDDFERAKRAESVETIGVPGFEGDASDLQEDINTLKNENRAIKELLAGLQSRVE